MGRTNHSYNGMLSAIARKSLPRFTNYAKDTASLSSIFGNEYSTINKRGNDSLTNIISTAFNTPEEYIKETNVGPVITLNGDRTVTTIAEEAYSDLGATADGGETVTTDTSKLDTSVVGTYTVSYSATDTEGFTRVENRFVEVVAPVVWTPGYTTVSVTLGDKLQPSIIGLSLGKKYVFDFSQTRGNGFNLSLDGTTKLTDGVIEAKTTLVYTIPLDFNSSLYYYSPSTPNIGGYFFIYNVVYYDQGILKIDGITYLNRGQTYTFKFSSVDGTTIRFSITEDGTDFTEGVTITDTSLTFVVPSDLPYNAIYIKSPITSGIGSSLTFSGTLDDGTIYFDNGILRATGITSLVRGSTYTFYFSSDYGTTIALSDTEDGTTFTEGVTTTSTSLTFVVPLTYASNTIYIKSPTTPGIGSSLTVSGNLKLLASDGAGGDNFGKSVSISEDGLTVIVGANGDDDNGYSSGSAYIYTYNSGAWNETKITAEDDGAGNDNFGWSVSISGDGLTAIVGAYKDSDNGTDSGSAFIYKYINGTWTKQTFDITANGVTRQNQSKLTPSDGAAGKKFGYSVSVSDDGLTLIVGANEDNVNGTDSGSVYTYKYINGAWNETKLLASSNGSSYDYFGESVSISGDGLTLVVGAYSDAAPGPDYGSVHTYKYINGAWSQPQRLLASSGYYFEYFGKSVSISSDGLTLIVGAYQDNDKAPDGGSAFIYKYINDTWTEQSFDITANGVTRQNQINLTASDAAEDDEFGISVSISSDGLTAIVGAHFDDDKGGNSGSVYIYTYNSGVWTETKLLASDGAGGDFFGESVSISGDGLTAIVGSRGDDDKGSGSGSVYIIPLL